MDGKIIYHKYTRITPEDFITLNEGFTIYECNVYKKDNHISGYLSVINDSETLTTETNIGTIAQEFSPLTMDRGIYSYCGEQAYHNRATLYSALSSNRILRVWLDSEISITQARKKYINFAIEYFC